MNNTALYQHINLDYMDVMTDGDPDMKKMMLDMLLKELPKELENMKSLVQQASWEDLGKASHKMKSTLAFVGNDLMSNSNKEIEQLAKTETNTAKIPDLLKTLEASFQNVVRELENAISEL